MGYKPLDPHGCQLLADALGETPLTVISVHLLRRGLCRAYVAGDPIRFAGAIIQADDLPTEPTAFGADAQAIWDLLQAVQGWECINVGLECAVALREIMQQEMGVPVRYCGEVYHILPKPAADFTHQAVWQLTLADLELLQSAPKELQGAGFGGPRGLLCDGIAAGAIVSGQIVAIAHTSARTAHYADIGVYTHPEWRRRGLAAAAASIVARRAQEAGQTPVWSTGEDNTASRRVAHKLGFIEVARRTYIIPEKRSHG